MKKISIMVPCYNEEENVIPLSEALIEMFAKDLPQYDYDITFIDNDSTDTTRVKLRQLCEGNKKIKAIFNAKNFGQFNSPYYGIINTDGDCTIPVCADFQDPIDVIPRLVAEWEKGYKIVIGIKTSTVKCEPFQQDGVKLKDVVTLEEAPRMGCGIMELDHTSFEWTLTYDEYDLVLDGTLEIEIDGRVVSGGPGDIIYIPKGSHIHFHTPNRTRYAYFVYPADWQ